MTCFGSLQSAFDWNINRIQTPWIDSRPAPTATRWASPSAGPPSSWGFAALISGWLSVRLPVATNVSAVNTDYLWLHRCTGLANGYPLRFQVAETQTLIAAKPLPVWHSPASSLDANYSKAIPFVESHATVVHKSNCNTSLMSYVVEFSDCVLLR